MRQNLKFPIDVRLRLILTFIRHMKTTHFLHFASSADARFVLRAVVAVAVVVAFILSIHLF